jgi:hypothetical protein
MGVNYLVLRIRKRPRRVTMLYCVHRIYVPSDDDDEKTLEAKRELFKCVLCETEEDAYECAVRVFFELVEKGYIEKGSLEWPADDTEHFQEVFDAIPWDKWPSLIVNISPVVMGGYEYRPTAFSEVQTRFDKALKRLRPNEYETPLYQYFKGRTNKLQDSRDTVAGRVKKRRRELVGKKQDY